MRVLGALALFLLAPLALAAPGGAAPPWIDPDAPSLPEFAASVRVVRGDEPISLGPFTGSGKRGQAAREALLPIFAARRGAGCKGAWLEVGPLAWLCSDFVEFSGNRAIDPRARAYASAQDGLPFRYYFVGPSGSGAYKNAEEVDLGEPTMNLEPGFAVAIVGERSIEGATYGMTEHGLWVPMRDLGAVHAFGFQGEKIEPGSMSGDVFPIAWVVSEHAQVFSKPNGGAVTSSRKVKFEAVHVLEEASSFAGKFVRIGDGEWLKASDIRHPVLVDPPAEVDVDAGEHWIDVDLDTQTLVAFEGKTPVFSTLVSTGKGKQGTALATPKGVHRIWIKMLSSDMDNLEDENAARYYRIENVPYVQYFSKGVGLHGAFWHRSFGHVRSHGCVNLSPLDAQRLFYFTGPHLPAGWTVVFPTGHEPGAVIRIR